MTYQVFTRTSWKANSKYPGGKEPCVGRKRNLGHVGTEEEVREMCREYNPQTRIFV